MKMRPSELYANLFDQALPPLGVVRANLAAEYNSLVYSFGKPTADERFWESPSVFVYTLRAAGSFGEKKALADFIRRLPTGSHVLIFGGLPFYLCSKFAQDTRIVFHYVDPRPIYGEVAREIVRANNLDVEDDGRKDYDACLSIGVLEFLGPEERNRHLTAVSDRLRMQGMLFVGRLDTNSPLAATEEIEKALEAHGFVKDESDKHVWHKHGHTQSETSTNGD